MPEPRGTDFEGPGEGSGYGKCLCGDKNIPPTLLMGPMNATETAPTGQRFHTQLI